MVISLDYFNTTMVNEDEIV